jgi:nuclear cap-binding protein subunit 1
MNLRSENSSLENADEVTSNTQHIYSPTAYDFTQLLDTALTVLHALDSSDFADSWTSFPQPYSEYTDLDHTTSTPFHLPSVLVPPEIIELDGLSTDAGEDAQVKKEEWPEYFQRLFDTTVSLPHLASAHRSELRCQ